MCDITLKESNETNLRLWINGEVQTEIFYDNFKDGEKLKHPQRLAKAVDNCLNTAASALIRDATNGDKKLLDICEEIFNNTPVDGFGVDEDNAFDITNLDQTQLVEQLKCFLKKFVNANEITYHNEQHQKEIDSFIKIMKQDCRDKGELYDLEYDKCVPNTVSPPPIPTPTVQPRTPRTPRPGAKRRSLKERRAYQEKLEKMAAKANNPNIERPPDQSPTFAPPGPPSENSGTNGGFRRSLGGNRKSKRSNKKKKRSYKRTRRVKTRGRKRSMRR